MTPQYRCDIWHEGPEPSQIALVLDHDGEGHETIIWSACLDFTCPPEIEKTVQDIAERLNHLAATTGGFEVHPERAPTWISQYFRRELERVLVLIRRNVLPNDLPNAENRLRTAIRFLDTLPEDAPGGPWDKMHNNMAMTDWWITKSQGFGIISGMRSEAEAIAVRDILNRLANDS